MDINGNGDVSYGGYVATEDEMPQYSQSVYDYPEQQSESFSQSNAETSSNMTSKETESSNRVSDYNYETSDYSLNSNYEEQTNYDIVRNANSIFSQNDEDDLRPINLPLIDRKIEEVIEQSQKLNFTGRMRIVLTSFIVIVASLMFATIWNFVLTARLNASIAEKEVMANELELSINDLTAEYNLLSDETYLKSVAEGLNYSESDSTNTTHISLDEMYTEQVVQDVPSNWFNDVCNFLTSIFS